MLDLLKTILITASAFLNSIVPQPTYIEGMVGQPVELNPLIRSGNEIDETIESLVFSGLVRFDVSGEIEPDLAQSWETKDDGKKYIFYLKEGVRFHNGQPITANDVAYSLKKLSEFRDVVIETQGSGTLSFTLKDPYAPFLGLLTAGVAPKDYFENAPDPLSPVGSGKFRVTSVKKGRAVEQIYLETADKNYNIKRITFKFYATHKDLTDAIKLGEINGYFGPKIIDWSSFNQFDVTLRGRNYAIFFNLAGPEFLKERALRRDLAKALDKDLIIANALNNSGQAVDGPIAGSAGEIQDITVYSYDPNLTASYDKRLTLTVPATVPHLKTADIIKESWAKLGVAVDIRPVAPEDMIEKVIKTKDFEALLFGQEVSRDPDRYTYWHSTQSAYPGLNFSSYEQMRVDKALEEGRKTLDRSERLQHYANFQRVLTADVPAIYLYQPTSTFMVSKKITDVSLPVIFHPKDRFLGFARWKFN